MAGNCSSGGTPSYASIEKQMAAYDALPKSVRAELANGYENWAAYPIRQRWERGQFKSVEVLVRAIERWNADQLARDRKLVERFLSRHKAIGVAQGALTRATRKMRVIA